MIRHVDTISKSLSLEIGYVGDIAPAGLNAAIIEALDKGGVLEATGIIYLRAEAPGQQLIAIDIWAPDPVVDAEPPTIPEEEEEGPEPNV